MQTIKYQGTQYQVVDVLAGPIGNTELINIFAAKKKSNGIFKFMEFSFSKENSSEISFAEYKSYYKTKGTIDNMQKFANPQNFNFTWAKFQKAIEAQIESNIKAGYNYTESQLMHDVMIVTSGREMSLDCVYQALAITNGHEYANYFKEEMLSNINWLIMQIENSDEEEVV